MRQDGAVIELARETDLRTAVNLNVCRLCHDAGEVCPLCGRCVKCGCKPWCKGA